MHELARQHQPAVIILDLRQHVDGRDLLAISRSDPADRSTSKCWCCRRLRTSSPGTSALSWVPTTTTSSHSTRASCPRWPGSLASRKLVRAEGSGRPPPDRSQHRPPEPLRGPEAPCDVLAVVGLEGETKVRPGGDSTSGSDLTRRAQQARPRSSTWPRRWPPPGSLNLLLRSSSTRRPRWWTPTAAPSLSWTGTAASCGAKSPKGQPKERFASSWARHRRDGGRDRRGHQASPTPTRIRRFNRDVDRDHRVPHPHRPVRSDARRQRGRHRRPAGAEQARGHLRGGGHGAPPRAGRASGRGHRERAPPRGNQPPLRRLRGRLVVAIESRDPTTAVTRAGWPPSPSGWPSALEHVDRVPTRRCASARRTCRRFATRPLTTSARWASASPCW